MGTRCEGSILFAKHGLHNTEPVKRGMSTLLALGQQQHAACFCSDDRLKKALVVASGIAWTRQPCQGAHEGKGAVKLFPTATETEVDNHVLSGSGKVGMRT